MAGCLGLLLLLRRRPVGNAVDLVREVEARTTIEKHLEDQKAELEGSTKYWYAGNRKGAGDLICGGADERCEGGFTTQFRSKGNL